MNLFRTILRPDPPSPPPPMDAVPELRHDDESREVYDRIVSLNDQLALLLMELDDGQEDDGAQ